MQTLRQLIASKAAAVFISDENLGWLPITLLLIIFSPLISVMTAPSDTLIYSSASLRARWVLFLFEREFAQIAPHKKSLASLRV